MILWLLTSCVTIATIWINATTRFKNTTVLFLCVIYTTWQSSVWYREVYRYCVVIGHPVWRNL